jgi:ABC-2 type transport system ATP-binding protein
MANDLTARHEPTRPRADVWQHTTSLGVALVLWVAALAGGIAAGAVTDAVVHAEGDGGCGGPGGRNHTLLDRVIGYRRFSWAGLKRAVLSTTATSSMVLLLAVTSNIFGAVFALLGTGVLIFASGCASDEGGGAADDSGGASSSDDESVDGDADAEDAATGDTVTLEFAQWWEPELPAGEFRALIDRFEVDVDSRLGELSRGQRSAVGVVLGLASRAPVTLLDESYLGMDAPSRYTFYDELLADFMEHPRTFVISTHLIGEVSRLFDHVTIIDHGRVLVHDDAEALRQRGFEVTGPADAVDRFAADHEVLAERQLGGTKAVTIHGDLDAVQRREAADDGLEVGPISLQDLFVHLTRSTGGRP